MKIFTKKDLKKCSGRNGIPVCIAFEGKVYDVSKSFLWQEGKHMALHEAGEDLSEHIKDAPHGKELLARLLIVGLYSDVEHG
jgi:predicted heme/steroid binding protein